MSYSDDAADVAARDRALLVAEHVVHERVAVDRERGDVVEAVGREARVAVAAEVGRDHLEARAGERPDVAPPDALRLRVAVQEQQRGAAGAFADVRDRHAVAHLGRLGRVLAHGPGRYFPEPVRVIPDSRAAARSYVACMTKTVMITGGSSGLGRQTAMTLAAQGVRLWLVSHCQERADAAQHDIAEATRTTTCASSCATSARSATCAGSRNGSSSWANPSTC